MAIVFQYGSNVCTARINSPKRLKGDARPVEKAQTVDDYDIAFDVWSDTNQCAAADLISIPGHKAWGVLYEISDDLVRGSKADRKTLAQIEGHRYEEKNIRVRKPNGDIVNVVTYLVCPHDRRNDLLTTVWYVSWVLYGLREHCVPEEYIEHVQQVAIQTNQRVGADAQKQIALIETL
jgi:hypothetical protein